MNEQEKQELKQVFASLLRNLQTTDSQKLNALAYALRVELKHLSTKPSTSENNINEILTRYFPNTDYAVIDKIVFLIITKDIAIE